MSSQADYSKKTRVELVALCKEAGLKGYSTKKKVELIELLEGATINVAVQTSPGLTKPFLKWVGGKTQILEKVLNKFPKTIQSYHEPFLGGGSVLLGLLSLQKAGQIQISGKIYASDLNATLIALYKNIQKNVDAFIEAITALKEEFEAITGTVVNRKPGTLEEATTSKESYYYWIRSQFNTLVKEEKGGTVEASAMFLFLNKTCFRGLYREGPNGFNVPYGHYENPGILNEEHLHDVSELIQGVRFRAQGFDKSLSKCKVGDFVYLDPPYVPENIKSFDKYNLIGFNLENHQELFGACKKLVEIGANFTMSNSDMKLVRDAFPDGEYETEVIECRRAINSKKPESKTNEVLIIPLAATAATAAITK
jgi:DNA adenine methylase